MIDSYYYPTQSRFHCNHFYSHYGLLILYRDIIMGYYNCSPDYDFNMFIVGRLSQKKFKLYNRVVDYLN